MNRVKVLIEGYAKELVNGWIASSTTTLVESNDKKIIIDPGCNREKLLQALSDNNIKTSEIDFVFLTHSHTDHALLAGIFEKAQILSSTEIYTDDEQIEREDIIPGTDIRIIETPGHSPDSYSLLVKTKEGVYLICADVFWWKEGEEQVVDINREDPYAEGENMEALIKSRKKVLKLADFIIPGHGKVFQISK